MVSFHLTKRARLDNRKTTIDQEYRTVFVCSGSVSIYTDPNPAIIKQKIKKTLISTGNLPSLKTGVNKPKFSKSKKLIFVDILKTTEEKSRPRIRGTVQWYGRTRGSRSVSKCSGSGTLV
jgi:hypothetical protein